jgi:transposase
MSKLINNLNDDLLYIGIDVSKLTLSIAYCKDGNKQWYEATIENTASGIQAFLSALSGIRSLDTVQCILEFTGTYSTTLCHVLADSGVKMSVITPAQSSAFAKVMKDQAKTDSRDARRLVHYGDKMSPDLYTLPSEQNDNARQLLGLLAQYDKQILAKKNQLEALMQRPNRSAFVQKALDTDIEHLTAQKKAVEDEICQSNNDDFKAKLALLTTICGVGEKIARSVLIQTASMESFTDVKQLIKFAGLAPNTNQSGTSLNLKGRIEPGNSSLRKILFLGSWSASCWNPACKALYQRLRAQGKPKMLALIAVAHKLLRQMWGVLKSNKPYDSQFHLQKTTS